MVGGHDAVGAEHADCHREVECSALFFDVGGGKVDGDPLVGKLHSRVGDGRHHSLVALLHSRVGKSYNREYRTGTGIGLDCHRESVDSLYGGTIDFG